MTQADHAQAFRYRAFISDSHQDKSCAGWLHKAPATYAIFASAPAAVDSRQDPFEQREILLALGGAKWRDLPRPNPHRTGN